MSTDKRLAAILAADRALERLARSHTLAGVPIPRAVSSFAGAAFAAGKLRAELALESYAAPARADALISLSIAYRREVQRQCTAERCAEPLLLPWVALT